jgi:hypothetical protein
MNNEFVLTQSQLLAERAIAAAGDDVAGRVRTAWRLALAIPPTEEQIAAGCAFIEAQQTELAASPASVAAKPTAPAKPEAPADVRALAALCQALFSSNAFLYVD